MKATQWRSIPLVALFVASTQVLAQSNVDSRVEKLEQTIQTLERRIAALEAQLAAQPPTPAVPADKVTWRKLKVGMTESDVEKLLGSPLRIEVSPAFVHWYFSDSPVTATIVFDGRSRKLERWDEPR